MHSMEWWQLADKQARFRGQAGALSAERGGTDGGRFGYVRFKIVRFGCVRFENVRFEKAAFVHLFFIGARLGIKSLRICRKNLSSSGKKGGCMKINAFLHLSGPTGPTSAKRCRFAGISGKNDAGDDRPTRLHGSLTKGSRTKGYRTKGTPTNGYRTNHPQHSARSRFRIAVRSK